MKLAKAAGPFLFGFLSNIKQQQQHRISSGSLFNTAAFRQRPSFFSETATVRSMMSGASDDTTTSNKATGRQIAQVVPPTPSGPIFRLIGTVDIDGHGTNHPLPHVDPFMLLDQGTIPQSDLPTFGAHPHRGHSVVTLLLQGQEKSWDSFSQTATTVQAPSSYWVDAGSGVFHNEVSVVTDPDDPTTHVKLFQLWISVQEQDRAKPAALQHDTNLPTVEAKDAVQGNVIGSITYFVGGENTKIVTPHPIVVAHVKQEPGTTLHFPVEAGYGGFLATIRGSFSVGSSTTQAPAEPNHILVLADGGEDVLEITTDDAASSDDDSSDEMNAGGMVEYLICVGEPIGEPWYKKLVASGAVIAASPQEARDIARQVETYAAAGKSSSNDSFAPRGSFAPFGA